jgi:hypothetical protein
LKGLNILNVVSFDTVYDCNQLLQFLFRNAIFIPLDFKSRLRRKSRGKNWNSGRLVVHANKLGLPAEMHSSLILLSRVELSAADENNPFI